MSLDLKKSVVSFEPEEILELERIVLDRDEKEALEFVLKRVYAKLMASQKARRHGSEINPAKPQDHMKNK